MYIYNNITHIQNNVIIIEDRDVQVLIEPALSAATVDEPDVPLDPAVLDAESVPVCAEVESLVLEVEPLALEVESLVDVAQS